MKEFTDGSLLGGRVAYRQMAAGHRSGFEPVLLAAAVPARAGERVLEAGTGAGAALLCLAARVPGVAGLGLEIVPDVAALAAHNFAANGVTALNALAADVLAFKTTEKFDHAMANPPWFDRAGTASADKTRALAHQAGPALLAGWVAALGRALKPRGTITLILPAASLPAAAAALEGKFGGLVVAPLWPRAGRDAGLVIIQGLKGAKGPARLTPGLVLHDEEGITRAAEEILRQGKMFIF